MRTRETKKPPTPNVHGGGFPSNAIPDEKEAEVAREREAAALAAAKAEEATSKAENAKEPAIEE